MCNGPEPFGPTKDHSCVMYGQNPISGLAPVVYSTDRSKAVIPVLVLTFAALWFILRGDLFYVLPCVILFLCFQSF